MAFTGEPDIINPTITYIQYQTQGASNIIIPEIPGSTAITTLNSLTGPTLTISAGTTGYSFSGAGTTITLSVSNAATIRSSIGLGTIATQNANGIAITGGTISGITDLAIADGGTGASTAAVARSNLAVARTNVAAVAPAVTDDGAAGFPIGTNWVDTILDDAYVSVDDATGAAIWKKISP